ncbi:MAG: ATP-binding protein [Heyndrickxia sp.]
MSKFNSTKRLLVKVVEGMNKELEQIGQKILNACSHLAKKLLEKQRNELHFKFFKSLAPIQEMFFHHLGYSFIHETNFPNIQMKEWANLLLKKSYLFSTRLKKQSLFPSYHYKSVMMDFLEEEVHNNTISPQTLILVIKKMDSFIEHASITFSNQMKPYIIKELRQYASSLAEENITLRELNDLKDALKEATILVITDNEDAIKYASRKFCDITKYSEEELIGATHYDLLYSGYHSEDFFREIREYINLGKVWKGEICNKAKDGSLYWVDCTIIPFRDRNGKTFQHFSIQFDITEQKNTEEMLRKTEKLSLVGEMAAGIAHEIRNPLTTIRGFVQILDHFSEEKKYLYSKTILEEIDRINFIVSEFMVFARPHSIEFKKCNIFDIIRNVVHLLNAETAMKNVVITEVYHQNDIFIYGEKNQLTQVFLNMLKNAIDALPNGGKINISSSSSDGNVIISVQDNGIGMSPEQVSKIGEPFYTLKENGNGLGLMVSYKIIENHRGRIFVESELNKGTTFHISFPVHNI